MRNHIVTGFLFIMPALICLVVLSRFWKYLLRVGDIVEENPDGTDTVFVPRAPAGLYGQVYVARPPQLKKLGIDSIELDAHLKEFGKGILTTPARPDA